MGSPFLVSGIVGNDSNRPVDRPSPIWAIRSTVKRPYFVDRVFIDFVQNFVHGFIASPVEIAVFAGFLAIFVAVLVVVPVLRGRRARRQAAERAETRYEELKDRHRLQPSEEEAVDILAGYLRRPEHKYVVLQNQGIFDECAERARHDQAVADPTIASLRVKLGFSGSYAGAAPDSSSELPTGSGVVLNAEERGPIVARLIEHDPDAFTVRIDEDVTPLTSGRLVEVIFQDGSGQYRFTTTVLSREDTALRLAHAEELERIQRRDYVRRRLKLPVYVRPAHSDRKPALSRFVDVGGGGASIANTGELERGDEIELTFHRDSDKALHVPGHVVRLSHRGKIAHIQFDELSPHDRDRIIGLVQRGGAQRG